MRGLIGLMAAVLLGAATVGAQGAAAADVTRAAETAILQADRDLAAAVAARSRDRFLALISPTAIFNAGKPGEARGRDAILEGWAPFFAPGGPQLSWEPRSAHVLRGGEVGMTIGTFTSRGASTGGGQAAERRGEYMTMWVRQADGRWLVVADTGSTPE